MLRNNPQHQPLYFAAQAGAHRARLLEPVDGLRAALRQGGLEALAQLLEQVQAPHQQHVGLLELGHPCALHPAVLHPLHMQPVLGTLPLHYDLQSHVHQPGNTGAQMHGALMHNSILSRHLVQHLSGFEGVPLQQ